MEPIHPGPAVQGRREHFPLPGFMTEGGRRVDLDLTCRHWGQMAPGRDNVVLLASHYTGTSDSFDRIIGPDRALDPNIYFIIAVDLFGNGVASSPSHARTPRDRADFPPMTLYDNVRAQALLMDAMGIARLHLIYGWSMGALQAWHWAAAWPERVRAILPVCGAARCWPQNHVFLEGVAAALMADPAWADGAYDHPPVRGLRAFGRSYAGWAYSPEFFREEMWRQLGFASLADLLAWWEDDHCTWDAANLMHKLRTWQSADVGRLPGMDGDWARALRGVRARVIAMPCSTDRYFTLEENAIEVTATPGALLRPLVSPLGHVAGAPGRHAAESRCVEAALRELLHSP